MQGRILILLVVLAAFLGLGWAYQDAVTDATKYKADNQVLKNSLDEAVESNKKLAKSTKVTDNVTAEAIVEKTEVDKVIDKKVDDVKTQILKIDKEFRLAPPVKPNTSVLSASVKPDTTERDNKVSKVLIDSLWDTYNESVNATNNETTAKEIS